MSKFIPITIAALVVMPAPVHSEWSANANFTNNYIWRGLTQSTNEPAVQGGIDYSDESGFYAGTWVSNVQYESDDVYSYEHDLYFGLSGGEDFTWDVGYLYYNYDSGAQFDFGEIYGSVGYAGFSASVNALANSQPDGFDFGSTYYLASNYAVELSSGVELGLHVGYHDGNFQKSFNGTSTSYWDYSVRASKSGFTFALTDTNLEDDGSFAVTSARNNDNIKFLISYGVDFNL